MVIIARLLRFLSNFFVCAENLGLASAWTIFVTSRFSALPTTIYMKRFERDFRFRGSADKGVMSHFYKPGYHIQDTPQSPIKSIIDCGANIGDETLRFRHFHRGAKIIALEAEAGNFELLQKNMDGDPSTTCLQKAVWPICVTLEVVEGPSHEGHSVREIASTLRLESGAKCVEGISLEKLAQDFELQSIDILKLDIEGGEYELFTRNYDRWIGLVRAIIFECNDHERAGTTAAVFRSISDQEFDSHIHGENLILIRRSTGWTLKSVLYY